MKLSVFLFLSIFFISSYKIHSADRNSDLFRSMSEKIEFFLNGWVDVDGAGLMGRSLLSQAAYLGRLDIVELLIMRGAKVDLPDPDGSKPLDRAIYGGHIEIVRLLLRHNANPNTRNQNDTPLLTAVSSNNFELVKLLIENKAIIKGNECKDAKSSEIRKLLGGSSCVIL